ncbi:hypothetical protein LEP1GSC096_1793 [Leptospira interrogans serovar Hebdomadis str. R499]|nr:hypothetical protein LEP1GSC096_1793 [Leptospira interrogans serovar Hebdomadis str. R499]EMJ49030.1 hypothetical protein LEP1GSC111_4477 [Leptospira interrogans str. UT126]
MILKKFLWNNSLFGKSFAVVFIFYSLLIEHYFLNLKAHFCLCSTQTFCRSLSFFLRFVFLVDIRFRSL